MGGGSGVKAGVRERRYADHIFIQIYFRMHHFVVKFSKFSSPQAARGYYDRYDTRCYFNVRSKANMSQLNLPHGTP